MIRHCCHCAREIFECMGFVKAGDLLEFLAGQRAQTAVRELCGPCSMAWRWTAAGTLEPYREELDAQNLALPTL